MSTNESGNNNSSYGLGGFLKRLLLAFLKVSLVIIILAVLAGAAWIIFTEINRSFNNVGERIDRNTRRIEAAEQNAKAALAASESQKTMIEALQEGITSRDARLTDLQTQIAAEQKQREELTAGLEKEVQDLISSGKTISDNVNLLGEGLVLLQQDITANVTDLDALGGQVDVILGDLKVLTGTLEAVQSEMGSFSAEEFERMRQALVLFRTWESLSRARIRLLEDNPGLAVVDMETASSAVEVLLLMNAGNDEATADLETLQQRLILAISSLPLDPVTAGRDLDTAWEAVDLLLTQLLQPAEAAAETPTP